ncbi:MAG TPA: hypothetical protein VM366_20780 [Anaerolineae bacterium]|nr:hypothetical protein [Anaerolineae bacterium]
MSTYKAKHLHIARSVLSIVLGGLCLLALSVLLGWGSQAADSPLGEPVGSQSVLTAPVIQANGAYTQYMPLIMRNYGALINGGFEQGLTGWETGQGPFQGRGSGLPVSAVALPPGHVALLGLTNGTNGSIPIGYGSLYQSFIVRERYLRFRYWVFSYDIAYDLGQYFDTFEISVNRSPQQISDAERNDQACTGAALNPQGLLAVPSDGLAFCGGRPGASGGMLWDTGGWRTMTLDLNAYRGQWITLYYAIWSREYEIPFIFDQAWHNTWAYVDDVHFTSSAATVGEASTDLPSPYVPAEARTARFPWNTEGLSPPR